MAPEAPIFPLVQTRFGRMFTLRGDAVVGRSLRLYGEFSGEEVDGILAFLRPGDHVVDLGANIGVHSLAMAQAVGPGGKVTAVEPQRYCFQLLCANVTLNQLGQVHCLRAAAGEVPGLCSVPVIDPRSPHNAGATTVSRQPSPAEDMDEVPLVTLDGLALSRCDLIKIDTEGFEDQVVAGALDTIATHRPVLYVEVHDRPKLQRVASLLRPLGYSLTLHRTRFYRAANPKGVTTQMFAPDAGSAALVGLPPGKTLPEGLPGMLKPLG